MFTTKKEQKERLRTISWLKQHGYNGIPEKRILNLLDKSKWQDKALLSLIREMDNSLGGEVLQQQLFATSQREYLFIRLPNLEVAKHFLVGENDKLVNIDALKEMIEKNDCLNSVCVLSNTGHMLPLEQTKQLAYWLISKVKVQQVSDIA